MKRGEMIEGRRVQRWGMGGMGRMTGRVGTRKAREECKKYETRGQEAEEFSNAYTTCTYSTLSFPFL